MVGFGAPCCFGLLLFWVVVVLKEVLVHVITQLYL